MTDCVIHITKECTKQLLGLNVSQDIDPGIMSNFLFDLAEMSSELATWVREELDKFQQKIPGTLAVFSTFGSLSRLKPHEFFAQLKLDNRKLNLTEPASYVTSMFASILLNHPEFIKEINFRRANDLVCGLISHRYVESGGTQYELEESARILLNKCSSEIANWPVSKVTEKVNEEIVKIEKTISWLQSLETQAHTKINDLDAFSRPLSIDRPFLDDKNRQDSGTTLGDFVHAETDMDTAKVHYREIISTLPEDVQPIFIRILDTGETLKQAAVKLGYTWTLALERQLERMKKKIIEQILKAMSD